MQLILTCSTLIGAYKKIDLEVNKTTDQKMSLSGYIMLTYLNLFRQMVT